MINTVKKCFSLAMVVAVVFSVLACIPAFAADSEAVSGLISNSSYYFIDFETGDDAKNTSQFAKYHGEASFAIHNEGAGGSAKSLKWTENNRVSNGTASTALHFMFKPNGAFPTFTVPAGYSVKYSFKLKLAQALTSGHLSVQTVVKSGGSTDYPNIWYTTFDNTETEKWQNISFVYTNTRNSDVTFYIQELLFSNNKDANATSTEGNYVIGYTPATDEAPADYGTRTYYFDDIEFGLFAPEAMLTNNVSNTANQENYYVNYENLPSNVASGSNAYYVKAYGSGYAYLADISANGSGHSLKVDPTGSTAGKLQMVTLGGNIRPKALKKGDTVTVAFDLKLGSAVADGEIATLLRDSTKWQAYFGDASAHYFSGLDKTNTKTWQHFELTFTAEEDKEYDMGDISVHFYKEGATNTGWTFVEGAADPFVYVDNLTMFIDRAAYPKTGVSVSGLSATGNTVGQAVNVNYTFNPSSTGATDNSVIRLVAKDQNGLYSSLASTTAGNSIVVPATAQGKELYLEVLASDSTGNIGRVFRTAVVASTPVITATTIVKDGTNVVVSAANDITDAKLIFVKYEGKKMTASDLTATVTVAANNTTTVAIPAAFQTGTVKIMLWDSLTNCVPLADVIE